MSAGGSQTKDGSGNGNPPKRYEVCRTIGYRQCRDDIEADYPRAVQERVFFLVELLLALFPPNQLAKSVGGKGWQLATKEGFCLPEIYVFFRFEDRRITLEFAVANE